MKLQKKAWRDPTLMLIKAHCIPPLQRLHIIMSPYLPLIPVKNRQLTVRKARGWKSERKPVPVWAGEKSEAAKGVGLRHLPYGQLTTTQAGEGWWRGMKTFC